MNPFDKLTNDELAEMSVLGERMYFIGSDGYFKRIVPFIKPPIEKKERPNFFKYILDYFL